jgi:hypothetical protein
MSVEFLGISRNYFCIVYLIFLVMYLFFQQYEKLQEEVALLKSLRHENVVRYENPFVTLTNVIYTE